MNLSRAISHTWTETTPRRIAQSTRIQNTYLTLPELPGLQLSGVCDRFTRSRGDRTDLIPRAPIDQQDFAGSLDGIAEPETVSPDRGNRLNHARYVLVRDVLALHWRG